jgi:hypothetical protein
MVIELRDMEHEEVVATMERDGRAQLYLKR